MNNIYVIFRNSKCYHCHIVGGSMDYKIPQRIRELRESKGLSTNKLSNMAGLSQSYVRKLEHGESHPTVESLELICEALGTTLVAFLSYQDASLSRLQAIKLLDDLSDEQLDGFCKLMEPKKNIES